MGWTDAPPSEAELKTASSWDAAPPSKDELSLGEKSSMLGSAARKALNGFEFGLSDEFAGMNEAATRMVGGTNDKGERFQPGSKEEQEIDPTLDWEVLKDAYNRARDHRRKELKKDSQDNPITSGVAELAGSLVNPVNKLLPKSNVASGAILGAANGLGNSEADSLSGMALDTGVGAGLGGLVGGAVDVAAPLISKGVQSVAKGARSAAEKFAVNSTGATGAQSAKFADDAGAQLLDRGLVKFGDSASNIADRTQGAMKKAYAGIDKALTELDARGVKASVDDVVAVLETKVSELNKTPGNEKIVKQLQGEIDNLISRGESDLSLSLAEKGKRNYQSQVNYASPEADKKAAFSVADALKEEVEKKALGANKGLSDVFTEGKKTYGLLAPIQEAAERRAATLNQSPLGGLLDTAASAAPALAFGGPGGVAVGVGAAAGRRLIAPRISSSAAVSLDGLSKTLMKSPQFAQLAQNNPAAFQSLVSQFEQKLNPSSMLRAADGPEKSVQNKAPVDKKDIMNKLNGSKYSQVLQNAAAKGDDSFNAAHFILSSRDEGYRKQISGEEN